MKRLITTMTIAAMLIATGCSTAGIAMKAASGSSSSGQLVPSPIPPPDYPQPTSETPSFADEVAVQTKIITGEAPKTLTWIGPPAIPGWTQEPAEANLISFTTTEGCGVLFGHSGAQNDGTSSGSANKFTARSIAIDIAIDLGKTAGIDPPTLDQIDKRMVTAQAAGAQSIVQMKLPGWSADLPKSQHKFYVWTYAAGNRYAYTTVLCPYGVDARFMPQVLEELGQFNLLFTY